MNEQAMSDITEEKGILHCQKGYKYATFKKKNTKLQTKHSLGYGTSIDN